MAQPVVMTFFLLPAGLLVNSMVAANQEITPELQSLAMKDPRFKKGQTRSKGGSHPPGGGKRRVGPVSAHLDVNICILSFPFCMSHDASVMWRIWETQEYARR